MIKEFKDIREIIEYSAAKFCGRTAFKLKIKNEDGISYDNITYERLAYEIKCFGKYLIASGLKGKRIAVIGKNSYQWMLVYLGTLCVNSVIVPLDKGLMEYEIKEQLKRAEADVIFYASEYEKMLDGESIMRICTDSGELDDLVKKGGELSNDDEYDNIQIDAEKMSLLLFTSGTTSKSKAVMLSQKNITSDVYGMSLWEKFYPTDVNMAVLPFHHAFGMTQIVIFLSLGVCNVFCDGLRVDRCMKEYGVTIMVVVPRIVDEIYKTVNRQLLKRNMTKRISLGFKISALLKKIGIDVRRKIFKEIIDGLGGSLRLIIVGAAPANPAVLKWFNDIGILSIQGYGLTETAPCIAAENEKNRRNNSVGKAIPNADVKIFEPDEEQIGEIIVKGDMVMLGYYNDDENTKKALKNGYFHTGDIGYIDKDGFLFVSGRKKNVIVLQNGKNVFPEEIEALLDECELIRECIVYNNDKNGKDCISAKIVYNKDIGYERSKKEIEKHIAAVNERLISYKKIRSFELTDVEMEKTTTLKIKR